MRAAAPPALTLAQALPVVLGRLPGLDEYTVNKVQWAIRAASRSQPPMETIERDLLRWLGAPAFAAAPQPATAAHGHVMARVYVFPKRPRVATVNPCGLAPSTAGVECIRGSWAGDPAQAQALPDVPGAEA